MRCESTRRRDPKASSQRPSLWSQRSQRTPSACHPAMQAHSKRRAFLRLRATKTLSMQPRPLRQAPSPPKRTDRDGRKRAWRQRNTPMAKTDPRLVTQILNFPLSRRARSDTCCPTTLPSSSTSKNSSPRPCLLSMEAMDCTASRCSPADLLRSTYSLSPPMLMSTPSAFSHASAQAPQARGPVGRQFAQRYSMLRSMASVSRRGNRGSPISTALPAGSCPHAVAASMSVTSVTEPSDRRLNTSADV